ncbi:MAG: ABC transporter permease [Proteobacteria bacterium]|nr:ABC transporter permease [Pseudomonadota bacterium]MDA1331222.1 ABC transporter permease [Pseudomonadota bacterium]
MNGLTAVLNKELTNYFQSPIAYFIVAVFLLGTGYFFIDHVFLSGSAAMDTTLQSMGVLLITVVPAISMRLFSAEYSGRTIELLMTLPLRKWEIVLGKYLGAVIIFLIMTLTTCINLIPLWLYGNPHILNIISGYVGFILLGMACIAIGQLFSALTENQIIAALMTWPVLLGFWFVGKFKSFQQTAWLRSLSDYLSFSGHYGDFLRGIIRSEGVIFFLAVTLIALILNTAYMQGRR